MISYLSITQIQYILISDDKSFKNNDFQLYAFDLLRQLPIDLLQTGDLFRYYQFNNSLVFRKGIDLFTFPDFVFENEFDKIKEILENLSHYFTKSLVKVFIIDSNMKNHQNIAKYLDSLEFKYFTIINKTSDLPTCYDVKYYFKDSKELIDKLIIDKDIILSRIISEYSNTSIDILNFKTEKTLFNINPYYYNNITETNYYIINQIIGNYWIEDCKTINFSDKEKINLKKPDRLIKLIKQSKTIDNFIKYLYQLERIRRVNNGNPIYPPLVLVIPFHFPRLKEFVNEMKPSSGIKTMLKYLQSEQDLEYRYIVDPTILNVLSEADIKRLFLIIHYRLLFIDCISYLHAQLTYSPVIRLPLVGKSINPELSYFKQKYLTNKGVAKTIKKFGKKLKKLVLKEELTNFIKNRNGQIVAISDLPIEWLYLEDFPICLTHDVCRIPEFNNNSIVNNYIHNQRLNITISSDIIRKTLIIHSASKDDLLMHDLFTKIDSFKDKLGFNSAYCFTISEIKNAIDKYKPELLIFDCHGSTDDKSLSSYLIIDSANKIYLNGDDIVNNNISAPIVFISACSTMPNYGYIKFLSDAFFEAGAFTVTATFLPISLNDAFILIVRLLNNLEYCTKKTIHSNWLEFVSHLLRTSFIHELVNKEIIKRNIDPEIITSHEFAKLLAKIMIFENRKNILKELNKLIKTKNPNINMDFENINKEWLLYTTIGRADLIYFDNWLIDFRKLNFDNERIEKFFNVNQGNTI